jgi:hypothetical protein
MENAQSTVAAQYCDFRPRGIAFGWVKRVVIRPKRTIQQSNICRCFGGVCCAVRESVWSDAKEIVPCRRLMRKTP